MILIDRLHLDRLHLLPNLRRQHNYICIYTMQLITKHFTSYSDDDAAKGERIVPLHCFRPDPVTIFKIYILLIYIQGRAKWWILAALLYLTLTPQVLCLLLAPQ